MVCVQHAVATAPYANILSTLVISLFLVNTFQIYCMLEDFLANIVQAFLLS
jgi:hypothetical protein